MAGKNFSKTIPDSDLQQEVNEGKIIYLEEKNENSIFEEDIEDIRNKILAINFEEVPFSKHDIKNIISKEVLSKIYDRLNITMEDFYYNEKDKIKVNIKDDYEWKNRNMADLELDFTIGDVLESKIDSDIPEFINNKRDIDEQYKYFDFNEITELKELSDLIKIMANTEADIDFNNLTQADIPNITQNIRERFEEISKKGDIIFKDYEHFSGNLNLTNGLAYKNFLKNSTNFHKNLSKLDYKEKKDYIDDLISLLMLLNISEGTINIVLKNS